MFKGRIFKRIFSGLSAAVMLATNALSLVPINAAAEDAPTVYAHDINVFSLDIKTGATGYNGYTYTSKDTDENGDYIEKTVTDGSGNTVKPAYVWKADSSNEGHKFVYNIKLSISGEGTTDIESGSGTTEEAVGAGFIKIAIPAHILRAANGDKGPAVDSLELPVPSEDEVYYQTYIDPVTNEEKIRTDSNGERLFYKVDADDANKKIYDSHEFVYNYDQESDQYIIYNTQPISAGVVYEFPVAYCTEQKTWNYQDLGASDPCRATLTIRSWEKDNQSNKSNRTAVTNEIPVYIDTSAEIKSVQKSAEIVNGKALLTNAQASSKTGLSLDAGYQYILWDVNTTVDEVTQKYYIRLNDTVSDITGDGSAKGEIIAYKLSGDDAFTKLDDGRQSISVTTAGTFTNAGRRTDYVLTRYKLDGSDGYEGLAEMLQGSGDEVIPAPAAFEARNDATAVLIPADNVDPETEEPAAAVYKFEKTKPTFHPVEEDYKAEKYGLYSSQLKRVAGKSNVSSYEMSKLAEDESLSDLRYETSTKAHAYGRTISALNEFIQSMTVEDGGSTFTVKAGSWTYVFDKAGRSYSRNGGESVSVNAQSYDFDISDGDLTEADVLRIAGDDVSRSYYGQTALTYYLDDRSLVMTDIMTPNTNQKKLGSDDYQIDFVDYAYTFRNFTYDPEEMEFSEGADNTGFSDVSDENTLHFYVYLNDSETPAEVGTYNVKTGASQITSSDLVRSLNGGRITFINSDENVITGYRIETGNKYFYVDLNTKPSVTLKPSAILKGKIAELYADEENKSEKKIGLKNTATWNVTNNAGWSRTFTVSGTDYIADIVRHSDIGKKRIGEKTSITGQDGNIYKSGNDPLNGQYLLAWQVNIGELADGVEVTNPDGSTEIKTNVPVAQQSGIFYDLLPSHSDVIEGSVNVYVDQNGDVNSKSVALDKSEFEVLDRIDNWNGSGRKLLIIKVNAPCEKNYYATYVTVHAHEDIQDYGSQVLNTVAYQTGNPDIGDGCPDNGGDRVVSLSEYMKNLDQPDNGTAKRFIYAEASEKILALFPTSSGIYKKTATQSNPTFGKSGTVHSGETYTYSIRMQNDSSTRARDIAILDSVENYRTGINSGSKDRGWHGQVVGLDLSAVKEKMRAYYEGVFTERYYTEHNITGEAKNTSDVKKAVREYLATDAVKAELATKLSALKLFIYTGSNAVNLEETRYSDSEKRQDLLVSILAGENPDGWSVADEENWRDLSGQAGIDPAQISAFIVYTGSEFELGLGGSLSFTVTMKAPRSPNDTEETYGHDTTIQYPLTYNNIYRSFTNQTEKIIPPAEEGGEPGKDTKTTYFYTHYDYTQLKFAATGQLEFSKADSQNGSAVSGVKYNLYGTSDYGTVYNETLTADNKGTVRFKNLERGRYTLIETSADPDHIIDTAERQVVVDYKGDILVGTIEGLTREYVIMDVEGTDENGYPITKTSADCLKISGSDIDCKPADPEGEVEIGADVIITEGKLVTTGRLAAMDEGSYTLYKAKETLLNDPRYHGEFEFAKTDSLTDEGVAGAVFSLKGVSDYQTNVDIKATSDNNGVVSFGDLETGTYTLTEITPAKGYMTASPVSYKVTATGKTPVVFKIEGITELDDAGRQRIDNTRLGELNIFKADSVTGNPVNEAKFELRPDSALVNDLALKYTVAQLAEMFTGAGFTDAGTNDYSRIIEGFNSDEGVYCFDDLPLRTDGSGVYILKEQSAENHKILKGKVTVTFTRGIPAFTVQDTNDEGFIDYVIFSEEAHKYKHTDSAEGAECIRIKNDPAFEDGKRIIKSWVGKPAKLTESGGVFSTFPELHLSSSEPEVLAKTVTFSSELKSMIQAHKADFTGIEKVDKKSYSDWSNARDADNSDEDTELLIRFDSATGKLMYCTNARTVNMPVDCSELFAECKNENFTTLDLSAFSFSKTTTMARMFDMTGLDIGDSNDQSFNYNNDSFKERLTSNLQQILFSSSMNTENVTSTYRMFAGCNSLQALDLTGFNSASVTNMVLMFGCCTSLEKLTFGQDCTFDNVTTSRTGNWKQPFYGLTMLKEFIGSQYLSLGKISELANMFEFVGTKVSGNTLELDLTGLKGDKATNITNMFHECGAKVINVENLDARNVTGATFVFYRASNLTSLKLGSKFTLEKANNIKWLFKEDNKLSSLDGEEYIKASNAENLDNLFSDVAAETIDISGMKLDFTKTSIAMNDVFLACSNLKTIYVNSDNWPVFSEKPSNVSANKLFYNAKKMKGGNGTLQESCKELYGHNLNDSNHYGILYAHVDGKDGVPGLFTDISQKPTTNSTSTPASSKLMASVRRAPLLAEADEDAFPPALESYGFTSQGVDGYSEKTLDGASDDDLGTRFSYEYFTADNGIKLSENGYQVAETVVLTVTRTVKEGGVYIEKSQSYNYNGDPLTATWKQVSDADDSEWYCEFKVIDSDAQMFGWEANVSDLVDPNDSSSKYKTQQNEDDPISTKGAEDPNAVITNTQQGNQVGGISVNKQISGFEVGSDLEKKLEDEFRITVTVTKQDGVAYTKNPFNEAGSYTFYVKPGDDPVVISGIPAGSTYTVTEESMTDRSDGTQNQYTYSYVSGNVTAGTIAADTTTEHEIVNSMTRTGFTLSKTASMQKYSWTDKCYNTPDASDEDYAAWIARKFDFVVTFSGLIPGDSYTYSINGGTAVSSEEQILKLKLGSSDSVVFTGLPAGASYTVTEAEQFTDILPEDEDSLEEVTDIYTVSIGGTEKAAPYSTETAVLTASTDTVSFVNHRKLKTPETVDLKVYKKWLTTEGHEITWLKGQDGKFAKMSWKDTAFVVDKDGGAYIPVDTVTSENLVDENHQPTVNIQNFLKVVVGRGLLKNGVLYEQEPEYIPATLNYKNFWSYDFSDLPKYGKLQVGTTEEILPYVYYVTEFEVTGFKNDNDNSAAYKYDRNNYSEQLKKEASFVASFDPDGTAGLTFVNKQINTYPLSVEKQVRGNFGNKAKDFSFTIEFRDEDGVPMNSTGLMRVDMDADGNVTQTARTVTVEGGIYSDALPDNTVIKFLNVPEGTQYTITENAKSAAGYEIQYKLNDNAAVEGNSATGVMNGAKAYVFINTLEGDVPTGIVLTVTVPALLLLMTFGGWIFYLRRCEKKEAAGE